MFLENNIHNHEEVSWIEVICGSMFSSKTEELIRRLRRAQFAKQEVEMFKPSFDTCYNDANIVSHNAIEIPSTSVEAAASILPLADGCDVAGTDETQSFNDEIVNVCNDLVNRGVRVIVVGLDMDYKSNPFGPMPYLMATTEYVTKVYAVCIHTGHLTNYSFRKVPNDSQCVLGEPESYEPLSRAAFIKARAKDEARKIASL